MNCNVKTMLKLAAGLGFVLTVAYFALPGAQALVLASAPILVALICPLTMAGMMFTMKRSQRNKRDTSPTHDASAASVKVRDVASEQTQ